MTNTLVITDSFKSTLSSKEIGELYKSKLEYDYQVIADGGEGSLQVLKQIIKGEFKQVYGERIFIANNKAYLETATLVGFKNNNMDVLNQNTKLIGQIINELVKDKIEEIVIFIGGTRTNDGGFAILEALGYKFLGKNNELIDVVPSKFSLITEVTKTSLPEIKITACCDVDNVLTGKRGATHIFGPQKGVTDLDYLDNQIARIAKLINEANMNLEGSGAGGGITFALSSFSDFKIMSGFDYFASILDLENKMKNYQTIITGEGKLDIQTFNGKVAYKVAKLAEKNKQDVIGVFGIIDPSVSIKAAELFTSIHYVAKGNIASEENLINARQNYIDLIDKEFNKNSNNT